METEKVIQKSATEETRYVYCGTNNRNTHIEVCEARAFSPSSNCPAGCPRRPENAFEFRSQLPRKRSRAHTP